MSYKPTTTKPDFTALEHEMLEFWRANDTFYRSLNATRDGAPFSFYDGPPFANGLPHWGHLGVSVVKDMVSRFHTMNGRHVVRELGWDCHGLPAENSVEKAAGKQAKTIVAESGMDAFCDMCRVDVTTYTNEWLSFIERMGRWVDGGTDYGYRTMDTRYMECVIGTLAKLFGDGYLYKDYSVNWFDWVNGTIVSNSEASQDYRDITDDAVTVWFQLLDGRRVLAWTTTPWTLPANSALAVNPKMKYAVMRDTDGKDYIVAESRLSAYEKQFADMERVETILGDTLVGLKYTPIFDYYVDEKLYSVIAADYVADDSGTGIVHIAPAFGAEDFWAVKNSDPHFPVILNVDNYGNFDESVRDWAGENIFEANPKIIEWLKSNGHLVKREQYKHNYPFGDRSKQKLIQRATDSWFIDVPKFRDKLLANNAKVNWTSAGERFAKWIENARPWAISRNRFWGTPLPIWERNGEYKIFGSVAELNEFFDTDITDLHRPTLDALTKDGWTRIPDILDCWVESGSMPWASIGFNPYTDDGLPANFPADYIIEGQDQTRGWFYALMVLSTAIFDKPAFRVVSANGMIVDENKKKFSKSLKNYVVPDKQIEQCGADAIRLFILGSNFMKAEPVSVDKEGKVFAETTKSILTPLWNAYHFFTLYANAGNITANISVSNNILDKYIAAELNDLTKTTTDALNNYQPDIAVKAFVKFLDILNNWYIRLNRSRFWDEEQGAFDTLYFVLTQFCKLLSPFAPFIADYIYKNLTGADSVHLEKFPMANDNNDGFLLLNMRQIQKVVSVGKQLREKYKLRNRLPINKITIVLNNTINQLGPEFWGIVREELNTKNVDTDADMQKYADLFVYLITPKIGSRLGAKLKEIITASKQPGFNPDDFGLLPDEFEVRLNVRDDVTGAALPDNTAVVVLDTNITPELSAEGLANDALRFIQDSRKAAGLDVSDRIKLAIAGDAEMLVALDAHRARIMADTLATEWATTDAPEYTTEIENHKFGITITRV
ncbi:MAG: isoleucine--tRNA ligase [Rickettsiales bacterium]|nr:isoleucine--tRNA ligase [Rickettsiales bacterium]